MKAVVVEIKNNMAALLSDEGCIVKVKNTSYKIGQEVEMNMNKNIKFKKVAMLAAVAACFLLVFGGGAIAYYTPTTYVSLDVNPSIEYQLNMFDRVLSVKAVNDDGAEIINQIELKNLSNKTIDEAIKTTVNQLAEAGYFADGEADIVITTSAKDLKQASELADNLKETAEETCEENECEAVVNAEAVGAERVAEAKELGVTPGKLNLVQKLIESAEDPDSIDQTEWLNKSVKDIMAKTNENKEKNKEQEANQGEESQNQEQNQNEESNGNGESQGNKPDESQGNQSDESQGNQSDESKGNKSDESKGNKSDESQGNQSDVSQGNQSDERQGNQSDESKGIQTDISQSNGNNTNSNGNSNNSATGKR